MKGKDCCVIPVGKKAVEYFRKRGTEILTEEYAQASDISIADVFEIAGIICRGYRKKEYGHVMLCYTFFRSMLEQNAGTMSLLPLSDFAPDKVERNEARNLILYEPDSEAVFDAVVPEYLTTLIYGALCESVASELAARRTAMDAATSNAEEMLGNLELYYNRARQAGITQEITEIVAGAEGL